MIKITRTLDHISYTVEHQEVPLAIQHNHFKHLAKMMDKRDASLPTITTLNGMPIQPFEDLPGDTTGMLEIIYEGVPYVAKL